MKVTVHNRKYNDTISFEVDELNEDIKKRYTYANSFKKLE